MNNIEIERKYKINNNTYENVLNYLEDKSSDKKTEHQNDIYFSPLHFPFFGGEIDNECLRLRILKDKNILSYKKFIPATPNEPAHCIEHEISIADVEKLKLILNDLRIEEAFTLKKERIKFVKNNIEICLDKVENLGHFIELEIINQDNLSEVISELDEFVKKFNITEEMRNYDGYSYLLWSQTHTK